MPVRLRSICKHIIKEDIAIYMDEVASAQQQVADLREPSNLHLSPCSEGDLMDQSAPEEPMDGTGDEHGMASDAPGERPW